MESHKLNFTVDPSHLDQKGRVRPGALLYYAQEAALSHCRILGVERLDNLFWAVIRHKVEITRLPEPGESFTVETWPMPTTRTAFPRVAFAYDEQGNTLFSIISLWVLMDKNTRAMVLPEKSGVTVSGFLKGCEPKVPASVLPKELPSAGFRQVAQEDIDRNEHMNNTRYLDWVWEALPAQWAEKQPKQVTICYLNEARLGQQMHLTLGETAPDTLQVEGRRQHPENPQKQERVFAVCVDF